MNNSSARAVLVVQSLLLFGGTVFAWSALLSQFGRFLALNGTLLTAGGSVPNPLLTACFYGSTAFLAALFWSVRVYQRPGHASERRLRNFLLFCVVFAASVVAYEAVEYYHLFGPGTTAFICTPGVPPVETPCFTGMAFFTAAFITSVFATRRLIPA